MEETHTEGLLDKILSELLINDASDLYITVGCPIKFRIGDKFTNFSSEIITSEIVDSMIGQLLNDQQMEEYSSNLEYNIAIEWKKKSRFRMNFFHQQRYKGIIVRKIKTIIPTIEELGLPKIYADLALKKKGLILISSPSGSGKSTSVAAMLGHRNNYGNGHIITIEDPIEYIHEHKNCIFTQREIGIDTYSYAMALKNALRQRADVIFIGEVRDRETLEHALNFAETGHLCISTLHSNNAHQAIVRIINFYPEELHKSVLITLSQNLEAIISQRLVPNTHNSRSMAVEIMLNVGLIKNLIADYRVKEIKEIMEKQQDIGMQTFDHSLYKMAKEGLITEQVALSFSENPSYLKLQFSQTNSQSALNVALRKDNF
jgi:twitching motility protein PilU